MTFDLEIEGRVCKVDAEAGDSAGQWRIRVDGKPVEADVHLLRPGVLSLLIGGQSYRVVLDANSVESALHVGPQRISYRIDDPRSSRARRRLARTNGPVAVKASMPGRVVRLLVAAGDPVKTQQGILVVEAMKMQNEVKSPKEGRVAELRVSPGDTVTAGEILAIIE